MTVPDSTPALDQLGQEFKRVAADDPNTGRAWSQFASAAALAIVLLFAFSFTPPGRAAADWVADQFRAGEPGGHPSATDFREFATEGTVAEGVPAHVVASGAAPRGGSWEYITFYNRADEVPCFETNQRDGEGRPSSGGGVCGQIAEQGDLRLDWGANANPEGELLSLIGPASMDVARVQADFDGETVDAELEPVPADLATRFGFDHPFQVYSAFFTDLGTGGLLRLTAFDASGDEIVSRRTSIMDPTWATPAGVCRLLRMEARRKGTAAAAARAKRECRTFLAR